MVEKLIYLSLMIPCEGVKDEDSLNRIVVGGKKILVGFSRKRDFFV